MSLCGHKFSTALGKYQRVTLLDCMVRLCLVCKKLLVFQSGYTVFPPGKHLKEQEEKNLGKKALECKLEVDQGLIVKRVRNTNQHLLCDQL